MESYNAMDIPAFVLYDTRVKGNTMPTSFIASYLLAYGRPELFTELFRLLAIILFIFLSRNND